MELKKGDKVRLSDIGKRNATKRASVKIGTFHGINMRGSALITWRDTTTKVPYHLSFVEKVK